jgi:hypothetical protein
MKITRLSWLRFFSRENGKKPETLPSKIRRNRVIVLGDRSRKVKTVKAECPQILQMSGSFSLIVTFLATRSYQDSGSYYIWYG